MSDLTRDFKLYVGTTKAESDALANKLYAMANDYINAYKSSGNIAEEFIKHIGKKDLRQDLVTEAYNCLSNGKYDKTKGTKEEFVNLAFDMVLSAHHFQGEEPDLSLKVYYKNPLENFSNSYSTFKNVA